MRTPRLAALAAAFFILAPLAAAAMDYPRFPRLDVPPAGGTALGGYQVSAGDEGTFELFTLPAGGGDARFLGRYNGALVGVSAAPDGRFLALTRDGALGVHGDNPESLAMPDARWSMVALAWIGEGPAAVHHDGSDLFLARPDDNGGWRVEQTPIAAEDRVARAELGRIGDAAHLFWSSAAGDLSRGTIRHAVLRDGAWSEREPLATGDVDAFTVLETADGMMIAALTPDVLGAAAPSLVCLADTGDGWKRTTPPEGLRARLASARGFAAAGREPVLWLTTGPDGAYATAVSDGGRAVGGASSVAPGAPGESLWSRVAGLLTVLAMFMLCLVYCRRSKIVSRNFPARPPDLISRGAALGVDWFLTSVAMGGYYVASGDARILPELLVLGDAHTLFWANIGALAVFTGLSESLYGCTPGKWLAGLRIRNAAGGAPCVSQVVLRNVARVIDMYPVGGIPGLVGLITVWFGPGRQRIGDMLAGTVVLRHAELGRRRFLLASASPRRMELLAALGVEVRADPSGIDEDAVKADTPEETVQLLSREKARAAIDKAEHGEVIVAADTVVVLDREVLGKPRDGDDARVMLGRLSGRSHTVFTGVTVWDSLTGQGVTDFEETEVEFRDLTPVEIDRYVATGDPLDKAGGYGIQSGTLVKQVRGSISNVAGLPMEKLQYILSRLDS